MQIWVCLAEVAILRVWHTPPKRWSEADIILCEIVQAFLSLGMPLSLRGVRWYFIQIVSWVLRLRILDCRIINLVALFQNWLQVFESFTLVLVHFLNVPSIGLVTLERFLFPDRSNTARLISFLHFHLSDDFFCLVNFRIACKFVVSVEELLRV